LKDLEIGISKVQGGSNDMVQFLAEHDARNVSQEALYKQVIEEKNKAVAQVNAKSRVNRPRLITGAISDFNNI